MQYSTLDSNISLSGSTGTPERPVLGRTAQTSLVLARQSGNTDLIQQKEAELSAITASYNAAVAAYNEILAQG